MAAPSQTLSARKPKDGQGSDIVVGSWRVMNEIGRGSFATVYKAVHMKNRSLVAVKSVHLQKLNKKLKENLYSEIDILKTLHHPHIVCLIDCRETSNHIHLVMEFCSLGDLSYFIKKRDKVAIHPTTSDMVKKYPHPPGAGLNEVVVRHFLKQLASALEFLRAKNFIHRDVKPQNLLLNPSSQYVSQQQDPQPYMATDMSMVPMVGIKSLPMLKLADFGFARSLPSTSLAETLCGSPLYMAPEILRYEKYDAKADLWSVGTVLYEMMTGRPPFRATNHVELLRKIEKGEDKVKFPEDTKISDGMKKLIRGLLKRNPVERMGFKDFFDDDVVKEDIPGLVGDDLPKPPTQNPRDSTSGRGSATLDTDREESPYHDDLYATSPRGQASGRTASITPTTRNTPPSTTRVIPGTPTRLGADGRRHSGAGLTAQEVLREQRAREDTGLIRRPAITTSSTAPTRQDILQQRVSNNPTTATAMERHRSLDSAATGRISPADNQRRERTLEARREERLSREIRERAEQDVAFERDYVVVEKKAVEVNAFADELAASPRLHGAYVSPHQMTRRATSQGVPTNPAANQGLPARAMQIANGRRITEQHARKGSYERRLGMSPGISTQSAISKALNMANFRLFGVGFSPPFISGKGQSPPQTYGAFPTYPMSQGSLVVVGESKVELPADEDSRAVHVIEESATRSDVVYGFAEVKYKQLTPMTPSMEHGLGLNVSPGDEKMEADPIMEDSDLTVDAIVTLSEEALVLYVKTLSLLAKSMDIAGAWWLRKHRGEVISDPSSPKSESNSNSNTTVAAGKRINSVVQWVRTRFNEVLEKAELITRKLVEAQKRLPESHPSHPLNHPSGSLSAAGMGTSANVFISSGITAEKLMYDRALEMSRAAALNELVGEDLSGCDIAYVTAIRMLEAILENDEDLPTGKKTESSGKDRDEKGGRAKEEDAPINGMELEDRRAIIKLVASMRSRLSALRKKMAIHKRHSLPTTAVSSKPATTNTSVAPTPTIATTPPR